jgi:cytochrome c-type biogenesis protein CcmH/NrfG
MAPDRPGIAQQIAHFEDRLREDPGSRVFLPLADLYRRTGDLDRARALLEQGLERQPEFVAARVALGMVRHEQDDAEGAREALEAVIAVDADNLVALALLTREAAGRQDWTRASALGERWLRLAPEDGEARDAVREARRRLELPAAAAATAGTIEEVPPPRRATPPGPATPPAAAGGEGEGFESPTLAELYLRQGHPDKARMIVERILAADPERADAREILDRIEARGDAPAARPAEPVREENPAEIPPPAPGRGEGNQELQRFRAWLDAVAGPGSGAQH